MKRSGGILKDRDAPLAILPRGDEGLNRVDRGIEVRLPGRHHPGDSAQDGNVRSQKTHASDFPTYAAVG